MSKNKCPNCGFCLKAQQKKISKQENILGEFLKIIFQEKITGLEKQKKIGPYIVDYYIDEIKLIIEYYGDFYHQNPDMYGPKSICFNKTAQEIWDNDNKRKKYLESLGYEILIIWESDFQSAKSRPEQIIEIYKKSFEKYIKLNENFNHN